ncbi:hypothetical protein BJ322DRAFT_607162 [Thelephora terrestris]|uniref:Mediator of RNA polymerase II transcription subunit 8 n=1 Tax=Thelephora terrestris TaxID=56493 RepID=A0A9P6L975_9AGAM|nr:hypothetical protein BJ322DRAFT_607162 [Thelephora terrestris]
MPIASGKTDEGGREMIWIDLGSTAVRRFGSIAFSMDSTSTNLPVAQLESLRFKVNQTIDSILHLRRILEVQGQNVMPQWPTILTRYNILLSQTHSLSTSLATTSPKSNINTFESLALHPTLGLTDAQFDAGIIPFLRNLQTTEVLRVENETVRRMSEHTRTGGTLGIVSGASKASHEDVIRECDQIKLEHDDRVDRAVKAVTMLREKYDWKARVMVEQEEPEELDWDPRIQRQTMAHMGGEISSDSESSGPSAVDGAEESNDSEEEKETEHALGEGSIDGDTPLAMATD